LIGKARQDGLIDLEVHDLRDFTHDRHRTVDDTPYGGGAGMVMRPEPWGEAFEHLMASGEHGEVPHLLVPGPGGARFTQAMAHDLAAEPWLAFACGRYEGIDERVIKHAESLMPLTVVSLGDYVLGGGEVAVLVMVEAIARLVFRSQVHVDANLWSFLVVILSIAVDYSRSRALRRVAKKYGSQALEADALHFATDIWSSAVVLLGLAGVLTAHAFDIPWLAKADAVAALGVAVVVVLVSVQLGKKSINDLLDTVPSDLASRIAGFAQVAGVREVRQVRVRRSGPEVFVDLVLVVGRAESLQSSHVIACGAEAAIKRELPGADVVVHVEPAEGSGEDLMSAARRIAASHDAAAHNLLVYEDGASLVLEMHLEMNADLPLAQSHRRAMEIDQELRHTTPRLARVVTHVEPAGSERATTLATPEETAQIRDALLRVPEFSTGDLTPQNIEIRRSGSEFSLSFRCVLPGTTSVKEAHDFTEKIERSLRSQIPNLGRIMARMEPKSENIPVSSS